jgi:hypothetical protein
MSGEVETMAKKKAKVAKSAGKAKAKKAAKRR